MPAWLLALDRYFPIRYLMWLVCGIGFLLSAFVWVAFHQWGALALPFPHRSCGAESSFTLICSFLPFR